jgi:hypothetical protein
MRLHLLRCALLATTTFAATAATAQSADPPIRQAHDGTFTIAGRAVQCERVRTVLDDDLPNLGAASPYERAIILNPFLMRRASTAVQLFVFHHECGHHHVGESELASDCWAVKRGVRDGWLEPAGLAQVCRSFGNAPETDTHPSGTRRCANLARCFKAAATEAAQARAAAQPGARTATAPKLIDGPHLLWSSRLR